MKILGIDPGFERVGMAIIEKSNIIKNAPFTRSGKKEKVLFSECFKTSAKLCFPERLLLIGEKINSIIKKYRPDVLAIETLFFTTNQKTAMNVSEARGVIIYESVKAGLDVVEFTPLQVKVAISSYGKADKKQVIGMVKRLVEIDNNKKSDDEMDAIAIALTASINVK